MRYNSFTTTHKIYTLSDTTASRVTPAETHSGMDITIQNINSSGVVYIGGEGVSSSNFGFRLGADHFHIDGSYLISD